MKKYFVCSDLHSFFTEFKEALAKNGFDAENQDHILVVCGDLFDRGKETLYLYNFHYLFQIILLHNNGLQK